MSTRPARRLPPSVGVLAGALVAMGLLHLAVPRPFDAIVPRALPEDARRPLTYASGVAEIGAGILLAAPATRRWGGRLTALLLLVVWPANVDAALRGGYPGVGGWLGSATAAWLRVPLQVPLIMWALAAGRTGRRRDEAPG